MKSTFNLSTAVVCLFGATVIISGTALSQGNNGGNANSNNNANGNALKWETQGNNADTSHFIGTTNPTSLKVRTNNTERMRITEDGKIGIGESDPIEKLEVRGNIKLSGDMIFSGYADPTDSLGKLLFVDKNGRTYTNNLKSLRQLIYSPIPNVPGCDQDFEGNIVDPVWNNGLNKIYNRCPINVGIRTSTPLHALDVHGEIRATRNIFLGIPISNFNYNKLARIQVVNLANLEPDNKGDFIRFDDYESSHGGDNIKTLFKVNDKGGLQIDYIGEEFVLNISSHSHNRKILQLNNNGMLRAREIKVDEDLWADYVFKPDYELMPLNKVKEFIGQNGHLPNVPSAKEIESDGINLGETARITMEKVEELTLYVIEQQEQLEEQKRLLKEQQGLLEAQQIMMEQQRKMLEEQSKQIEEFKKK